MALSCSSLCITKNPYFSLRLKVQLPQARSHNFPDEEGKASNAVDANMSLLRKRMERVRMRERERVRKVEEGYGWNYKSSSRYDDVQIKKHITSLFQLAYIACTTIGFVFLTGSLCIFLISFICSSSN